MPSIYNNNDINNNSNNNDNLSVISVVNVKNRGDLAAILEINFLIFPP